MESTVGEVLRITLFGESHGSEIGVTIDGFPAGQVYTPPAVTVRMVLVVMAILPILIIFPFFHRFLKNGMTIGAVKG